MSWSPVFRQNIIEPRQRLGEYARKVYVGYLDGSRMLNSGIDFTDNV